VVDASGERIPGAEVELLRDGTPARTAFTDPDGTFRLTQVSTGRYEIVARRDGFARGCRAPWPIILPCR
jgi:hypothetical protein